MGELKFIKKNFNYGDNKRDVSIGIWHSAKKPVFAMTIRKLPKELADAEYLVFAVQNNTLYIDSATSKEGFKITALGRNRKVTVRDESLVMWAEDNIGDYDFIYDTELQYYCIKPMRFIGKVK